MDIEGPLLFCRTDPIEVTRPYRLPGAVCADTRRIISVDAVGLDVPVGVSPPDSAGFRLGRNDERAVRRRTAQVGCHDPVLVDPELPPLVPFRVPAGKADTLNLTICAGQYFLDRAATGGTPGGVMFSRWRGRVVPCTQPEIELIVGLAGTCGPDRSANHQGAQGG